MKQPVWNTAAGSLGNYPSAADFAYQLSATPQLPAVTLTYSIISGTLPTGLSLDPSGLISGMSTLVLAETVSTFVVRATDNYGNIRDRTFSITMSGSAVPSFSIPAGSIATLLDSVWTELPITFNNPITDNPVTIRKIAGILPPGLEINEYGLIRGYAAPPTLDTSIETVVTSVIATSEAGDTLTCLSTSEVLPGRPVIFSGTVIGGIIAGKTYYVREVLGGTTFTVSYTSGGSAVPLVDSVGYMTATFPSISVGQPTNKSYSFTLKLESPLGTDTQLYSIEVINQNTPVNQGGPGYPPNNRVPTILNTRPETYLLDTDPINYGYYVIPPNSQGETYSPAEYAYIGKAASDNKVNFRILGHDFDGNDLTYNFSNLPLGLTGDPVTGWVSGNPIISNTSISEFNFSVYVSKVIHPDIVSATFNFSFVVRNDILGDITWVTPEDMGIIYNGTTSMMQLQAASDVPLSYRLTTGILPPNLTLLPNGELAGVVSFQPDNSVAQPGTSTDFTFTVQAYSEQFPIVNSYRTFTLSVYQLFANPFETLYCKCTPSIPDRNLLKTLLENDDLIPPDYLYRSGDPNFGKATSVSYQHAYGIYANDLAAYTEAISKQNHYWRSVTLGEIRTAVARDELTGEILYEVVYSYVHDNLVNYGKEDTTSLVQQTNIVMPNGVSVSKEVYWPRRIPLFLGPWYDSSTDIYASYEGKNSPPPTYYTSLTPGYARLLYPNSLPNMRQQVADTLGQEQNYLLLPTWMTSQQLNGSTLGYTPAWVIAYCKPEIVTLPSLTIASCDHTAFTLAIGDTSNLNVGDLISFTGTNLLGDIAPGQNYYVHSIPTSTTFTISRTLGGTILPLTPAVGTMTATPYVTITLPDGTITHTPTYAQYIQYQIQHNWKNEIGDVQTLNTINFELDRFTVNKSNTYNFDNTLSPAAWTTLPGATPEPSPTDSKDFYVLFPRETILPDETQYKQ